MLKIETNDGTINHLEAHGNIAELLADIGVVIRRMYVMLSKSSMESGACFRDSLTELINDGIVFNGVDDSIEDAKTIDDLLKACGGEAEP